MPKAKTSQRGAARAADAGTLRAEPSESPPKLARGAASKAARHQDILSAARDVFARLGYHRATVEDIVAAAGVARGTFYLYFEDKRAVFAELVDRFSARLSMAIQSIVVGDPALPVDKQIEGNVRGILAVALNDRPMTKILFTDTTGIDPAFDRRLAIFYDEVVQLLSESLRTGQMLGIVADGEPRVLAYLTVGALKELLCQLAPLGITGDSAEALTRQVFAFLSHGYLRVGTETPPSASSVSSAKQKRSGTRGAARAKPARH